MAHQTPPTLPIPSLHRTMLLPLLALAIFALTPLGLQAQTGARPHATPALINRPGPVVRTTAPPRNGAATTQPAVKPPVAPPTPAAPPAGGGAITPANAPTLIYEGAPTTTTVRSTGGALPERAGEALPSAEPAQPRIQALMKNNATIDDIFKTIRDKTGVQVKAIGAVAGKVIPRIQVRDQTVEDVLNTLANQNQWVWIQRTDGTYEMRTQEDFNRWRSTQTQIKVFQLHFIDAEELVKVVQPLLTPEIGAVAADARSNKLIVTDLPGKLGLVESILREYDVQVYTHVFEVKNAALDTIKEQFDTIKSKAGEMYVDEVNRTIIVKDTFDKIKQMDQLLQILDRDVETRVYNLTNLGSDNDFAEDLISDFLEPLKSKDDMAVMKYNKSTGKLYVRDIRAVQEKILQTLRKMDTPRKQVRIEGEILTVAVNHQLNIGTEWTFSHNLKDAFKNPFSGISNETKFNTQGLPVITGGKNGLVVTELTHDIQAQLTAALTDSRTRLLLRPRITIANNETGSIQITRDEPVLQTYNYGYGYGNTNNGYTGSSGQMTYQTGLALMIQPAISNRGLVELKIQIQNTTPIIVDNIGGGVRGVGSSGEQAQTMLIIPSGETRVIGGLISRDVTEGKSGIPVLSELPWVGWMFGSTSNSNSMRNLMFFITPTIVEEQPQNDLVAEAVNPLAEVDMKAASSSAATPPAQIGEIPPELRPYLKEIQPAPLSLPAGGLTSGTVSRSPLPGGGPTSATLPLGEVIYENEETTATAGGGAAPLGGSGSRFLSNEPYAEKSGTATPEIRIGGAIPAEGSGKAGGPSGVFGGGAGAATASRGAGAGTARGTTAPAGTTRPTARPTPRPSGSRAGSRGPYSTQGLHGGSFGSSGGSYRSETNY